MEKDASRALAKTLRDNDYDRWLAQEFAPSSGRAHLCALYAFNYEIAKTAETVSQAVLGQIRLQWWRDAIADLYGGPSRVHAVVQALAAAIRAHDLPRALFDAMIDAREHDLEETPFADEAGLRAYTDASSGHLMRLAARILGAGSELDKAAGEAGSAYALAGLLRALPFQAARRHCVFPQAILDEAGLTPEEVFAGPDAAHAALLIRAVAARAHAHLARARETRIARTFLPAFLPAALAPLYLRRLQRGHFDLFRDVLEFPRFSRQIVMLGANLRGKF